MAHRKSVLFVCLGNICRSPAAEGIMQHIVKQHGLEEVVRVDSAGTSSYHIGEPADKRMCAAAEQRGYELKSRSRQVGRRDFREFDLIVAMDRNNYRELRIIGEEPITNLRMLSDFLDSNWPRDVPDPYYGGDAGFHQVLDMLEVACPKILQNLIVCEMSNNCPNCS